MYVGAYGHKDRLSKCGKQNKAPAFQPHGHKPEHLLCHVFEGSSTDKEAIVSPLLLPQTICTLPWVVSHNQSTEWLVSQLTLSLIGPTVRWLPRFHGWLRWCGCWCMVKYSWSALLPHKDHNYLAWHCNHSWHLADSDWVLISTTAAESASLAAQQQLPSWLVLSGNQIVPKAFEFLIAVLRVYFPTVAIVANHTCNPSVSYRTKQCWPPECCVNQYLCVDPHCWQP